MLMTHGTERVNVCAACRDVFISLSTFMHYTSQGLCKNLSLARNKYITVQFLAIRVL